MSVRAPEQVGYRTRYGRLKRWWWWWCDDGDDNDNVSDYIHVLQPLSYTYSYTLHTMTLTPKLLHIHLCKCYYDNVLTVDYTQSVFVTSCYCACICIHNFTQIVVPVHILHLFCSMPVLIIVCTLHRCFHAYSHTHMKILFTYRHIKSVVTFVCVQYIASWMHLHVYILFVYFITCMCAYLWYTQHRYQYGSTFEHFCIYTHIYIFAIADVIILFCLLCVRKIHVCV